MVNKGSELKKGKIYWLIRKTKKGYDVVGFMRERHRDGFLVIGGPTDSHFGGHGENWRIKLEKLVSDGYVMELVAKEKKIIPSTWKVPKISKKDKELIKLSLKISRIITARQRDSRNTKNIKNTKTVSGENSEEFRGQCAKKADMNRP